MSNIAKKDGSSGSAAAAAAAAATAASSDQPAPAGKCNTNTRKCKECGLLKDPSKDFSNNQRRKGKDACCKECIEAGAPQKREQERQKKRRAEEGERNDPKKAKASKIRCVRCNKLKGPAAYLVDVDPNNSPCCVACQRRKIKCTECHQLKYVDPNDSSRCIDCVSKLRCTNCRKNKGLMFYPVDVDQTKPTCLNCVYKTTPVTCPTCGVAKTKNCFSTHSWSRRVQNLPLTSTSSTSTPITLPHATNLLQQAFDAHPLLECLACCRERRERTERAHRSHLHQQGIDFYDWNAMVTQADSNTNDILFSQTPPDSLLGEYNILFLNEWGDGSRCRTCRGTLKLYPQEIPKEEGSESEQGSKVVVAGTGVFPEELREEDDYLLNYDFHLSNAIYNDTARPDQPWRMCFDFRLMDEEAAAFVHRFDEFDEDEQNEFLDATLMKVQQRCAIPWTRYEESCIWNNCREIDRAPFETLAEAEELVKDPDYSSHWMVNHKLLENPDLVKRIHGFVSRKPKLAFFLEPGDLVLSVCTDEDHGFVSGFEHLLRKA